MGGYYVLIKLRSAIASIAFLFCCIAIFGCQTARASELEFVGNTSFPSHILQKQLDGNSEYFACTRLNHNTESEPALVKELIERGYRIAGFPDATANVTVSPDSSRLIVRIEEGERFHNGSVHIKGASESLENQIIRRLTTEHAFGDVFPAYVNLNGKEKSIWKNDKGKSVSLSSPAWEVGDRTDFLYQNDFISFVQKAITKLGYPDAKINAALVRNVEQHTADLNIEILEIGEARRAENIYLSGIVSERHDDLLNYVKLKPGDPVDSARIQDIVRLLWASGRFSKQRVTWDKEQPTTLKIEVEGAPGIPWLDQQLSDSAKAILKCQQWLMGFSANGGEVEAESPDGLRKIIVSSKGVALDLKLENAEGDTNEPERLQILVGEPGLIVDCSRIPDQFRMPIKCGQVDISIGLESNHESAYELPPTEEESKSLVGGMFKLGGSTERSKGYGLVNFSIDSSPADLLPIVYRKDLHCEIVGNNLQIEGGESRLVIDINTGEVLEAVQRGWKVRFGHDFLAKAEAALPVKPNRFDIEHLFESTIKMCFDPTLWEFLEESQIEPSLDIARHQNCLAAITKLASMKCLKQIEDIVKWYVFDFQGDDYFSIPERNDADRGKFLAKCIFEVGSCFEPDSWPAQLAGAQALILLEKRNELDKIIDQYIHDPKCSSISCALMADCLYLQNQPRAKEVAKKGLELLNSNDTEGNWQAITTALSPTVLLDIIATIQTLSKEELSSFKENIPSLELRQILNAIKQYDAAEPNELVLQLESVQRSVLQEVVNSKARQVSSPQPVKKKDKSLSDAWDLRSSSADIVVKP